MFENIINFFKKVVKSDSTNTTNSKDAAKERLHLVLIQDRASVSSDFLEVMKQEIIEVIKKYIDIDENAIDVRLTNNTKEDGTTGAPALYANFPITNVKTDVGVKKLEEKGAEIKTEKSAKVEISKSKTQPKQTSTPKNRKDKKEQSEQTKNKKVTDNINESEEKGQQNSNDEQLIADNKVEKVVNEMIESNSKDK